jgi:hypothetical protein
MSLQVIGRSLCETNEYCDQQNHHRTSAIICFASSPAMNELADRIEGFGLDAVQFGTDFE